LQLLVGHALGTAAAGCPLAHDAQGSSETFGLQAAPKFGSIAAAGVPQFIQQRQVCIDRALPNPEIVSQEVV
jgi:hypothetical protein